MFGHYFESEKHLNAFINKLYHEWANEDEKYSVLWYLYHNSSYSYKDLSNILDLSYSKVYKNIKRFVEKTDNSKIPYYDFDITYAINDLYAYMLKHGYKNPIPEHVQKDYYNNRSCKLIHLYMQHQIDKENALKRTESYQAKSDDLVAKAADIPSAYILTLLDDDGFQKAIKIGQTTRHIRKRLSQINKEHANNAYVTCLFQCTTSQLTEFIESLLRLHMDDYRKDERVSGKKDYFYTETPFSLDKFLYDDKLTSETMESLKSSIAIIQ